MPSNEVRIIGGKWKGRKVRFPDVKGLRPSLGRARETLFNWLAPTLPGSHCLDLFAGSGSLGLEAESRGAGHVTLVEQNARASAALREATGQLNATARVLRRDGLAYARATADVYDLVFLDPPFDHPELAERAAAVVLERQLLTPGGMIYLELPRRHGWADEALAGLYWHRQSRAGDVTFGLLATTN